MIVVDASAFIELLTADSRSSGRIREALLRDPHWCTTEHFRIEVANSLRRLKLARRLSSEQFDTGWAQVGSVDVDVWPTVALLPRIRELHDNASSYDAAYVALAEDLGCALVTADVRLARTPGARCQFLGVDS